MNFISSSKNESERRWKTNRNREGWRLSARNADEAHSWTPLNLRKVIYRYLLTSSPSMADTIGFLLFLKLFDVKAWRIGKKEKVKIGKWLIFYRDWGAVVKVQISIFKKSWNVFCNSDNWIIMQWTFYKMICTLDLLAKAVLCRFDNGAESSSTAYSRLNFKFQVHLFSLRF